jgi:hypothetical protein
MSSALAYVGAAIIAAWGVIHAAPTGRVLASFAPITADNRLTIKQEWLAEAFTMWGVAAIIVAVTAAGGSATARDWVYRAAAGLLIALGILTAFTGARTPVIWFKVCVFLLAGSGALLLAASAV